MTDAYHKRCTHRYDRCIVQNMRAHIFWAHILSTYFEHMFCTYFHRYFQLIFWLVKGIWWRWNEAHVCSALCRAECCCNTHTSSTCVQCALGFSAVTRFLFWQLLVLSFFGPCVFLNWSPRTLNSKPLNPKPDDTETVRKLCGLHANHARTLNP